MTFFSSRARDESSMKRTVPSLPRSPTDNVPAKGVAGEEGDMELGVSILPLVVVRVFAVGAAGVAVVFASSVGSSTHSV